MFGICYRLSLVACMMSQVGYVVLYMYLHVLACTCMYLCVLVV